MQPENDTQAVRRVLARAGVTAAALTLTLGAAAPAAFAGHSGGHAGGGSNAAGHDKSDHPTRSGSNGQSGSTEQGSSDQRGGQRLTTPPPS